MWNQKDSPREYQTMLFFCILHELTGHTKLVWLPSVFNRRKHSIDAFHIDFYELKVKVVQLELTSRTV